MAAPRFQAYMDLAESEDLVTFRRRLVRIAEGLGFPLANATAVTVDAASRKVRLESVRNAPQAWENKVWDKEAAARDPTLQLCRSSVKPFTYDQALYVGRGAGDLWEEQAPHGYRTGINAVLHLGQGRHFYVGMDRDEPLPGDPGALMRMLADLQFMAAFVQDAAFRLLLAQQFSLSSGGLSPREREVLAWASAGKTAWETGALLSISEHTVNKHLAAAAKRLGCVGKAQTIARALALGIL